MSYEVNNVRFGNYSIGNPQQGSQKKANEGQVGQESAQPQNQTQSTFNPDSVMSALGNMGAYNLISINKAEKLAFFLFNTSVSCCSNTAVWFMNNLHTAVFGCEFITD